MSLLPASASARRAEEAVRERARAEAFDRGYAHGSAYGTTRLGGAASAASTTPTVEVAVADTSDPAIRSPALDIGQDRILLPPAVTISRTFTSVADATEEGEEIATHISFGHVTLTIEDAVREGVLDLAGRFNHYRSTALLHATRRPGAWVHPMGHNAAKPAVRARP
jgi:hypothetical protein